MLPGTKDPSGKLHVVTGVPASPDVFQAGFAVTPLGQLYMADVEVPPTRGPELVVNGTFDSSIDGWLDYSPSVGSWDATGQRLMVTSPGVPSGVYQVITTVAGKTYELSGDIAHGTSNGDHILRACNGPIPAAGIIDLLGPGHVVGTFVAQSTQTTVYCRNTTVEGTSYWDNLSVREVL
jgi:hypothetical protein